MERPGHDRKGTFPMDTEDSNTGAEVVRLAAAELELLDDPARLLDLTDGELANLSKVVASRGHGMMQEMRAHVGATAWAAWHRSNGYDEWAAWMAALVGVSTGTIRNWRDAVVKEHGLSIPATATLRRKAAGQTASGTKTAELSDASHSDAKPEQLTFYLPNELKKEELARVVVVAGNQTADKLAYSGSPEAIRRLRARCDEALQLLAPSPKPSPARQAARTEASKAVSRSFPARSVRDGTKPHRNPTCTCPACAEWKPKVKG